MTNHERTTIRCWTTRFLVITVIAVVGPAGRGYIVEARTWRGTVVAALGVPEQHMALRHARQTAAGGHDAIATKAALRALVSAPSSSPIAFPVVAGGVQ